MIIVLMGVAGSGKTTVGTMLAETMKCSFLEGDSLHSKENIDKMSHGIPLTDADRAPWLHRHRLVGRDAPLGQLLLALRPRTWPARGCTDDAA